MSWFSDLFGFGDQNSSRPLVETQSTPMPVQLPDYPEATTARQNWGQTLQSWQTQPGYGAIQPDWNNIWDNARQKVQRYFNGGPEGPGANATVEANLARRGMSETPAADTLLQRSGFQQGNNLADIATQEAGQQAQLGEQGRQTWLSSLMNLAGLKPSFAIGNNIVSSEPGTSFLQGLGDAATSIGGNVVGTGSSGFDWLDHIMGLGKTLNPTGPGGTNNGSANIGNVSNVSGGKGAGLGGFFNSNNSFGQNTGDVFSDPQTYQQLAQILAMFA